MKKIEIIQGDITKSTVDAIVNAANPSLMGGGGVDGAIHKAAGPKLNVACHQLDGCETGEAKTTAGFDLPARYIIHTPGPIWYGGQKREPQLLYNSYWHSLEEAEKHQCKTVDFPSISTGVYGYPLAKAAPIAIKAMQNFLKASKYVQQIRLVAFDPDTKQAYEAVLN